MNLRHFLACFLLCQVLPGAELASGTVHGPLEADGNTSFYLYLPKDLNPELKSPVMIWTQSDGGKRATLEPFSEAADALGMIIATPVEARFEGEATLLNNFAHASDVLTRLKNDFRIQPTAVHFGGDKSGGAAAFENSARLRSAGTFTVSGYFTPDMKAVNEGRHFMAGQSNSSTRYRTAWTAAKFGEEATHYLYEGTREMPGSDDVVIGMTWMYVPELYDHPSARSDEAREFERRFLPWLKGLADRSPGEAAYLTDLLLSEGKLKGQSRKEVQALHASLARQLEAVAHVRGREALDDFSEKEMARYGNHNAPLPGHLPATFERLAARLATEYRDAKRLQPIFKRLAEPTHQ